MSAGGSTGPTRGGYFTLHYATQVLAAEGMPEHTERYPRLNLIPTRAKR